MSKFLDYVTINPKITLNIGDIYPFVEMGNVSTCYREPVNIEFKPFDSGVKFQDGDTVIARITPCLQNGKRFFCKNIGVGFGSTEFLVFRPKNNDELDNRFLYYFMQQNLIVKKMIASMTGATGRQRVNNAVFQSLDVVFPDIDTQHRIADILSAYDDLIENSRKQIKLLEEAAQRLYREWFVDLRFPGHEDTAIIDGVPEGWKEIALKEIADFKRGKTITKAQTIMGTVPVVAGGLEPAYYHNVANTTAPVITVSGSGANAGFTRIYHVNVFASDCSFVDQQSTDYPYFVLCFMKENKAKIDILQKGSAQPHVYAKDINALRLLIPSKKLLNIYEKTTKIYFELVKTLEHQCKLASEARDRLMPKLMSGEIEV